MYTKGVNAYRQTDVLTADPKKLVAMCYKGAIGSLKVVIQKDVDAERKVKSMQKAMDIIQELNASLDFEKGGQIAKNLDSLYNYMLRRLLYGEAHRETDAVVEVIGMLEELKGAWEEVFFGKKASNTISPSPHVAEQFENQMLTVAYGSHARL
jgi:flagellar protein FliS